MVAVVLAQGFEEVEAITPIDFLRRAKIEVAVIGVGGTKIRGAHGIEVVADISLDRYQALPTYLVLPGGMPGARNLFESQQVRALLSSVAAQKEGVLCAICAAPAVVLAPYGYLANRRFTCYPTYANACTDGTYVEEAVVSDDALITSRGAGTAAHFSAEIIARIKGRAAAEKIMQATLQLA